MVKPFKGQYYGKIRRNANRKGQLFTDPLFPPSNASLFVKNKTIPGTIEWKRPGEICSNPKLFVEGISTGDVVQGRLGNCWFVAACSVLAGCKELWNKVIPNYKDQEWDQLDPSKNYTGAFHFCFWRFGQWVDVVVDDLLPTINGRLIFTHSQERNEFWCALLEKAYAKVNGCYEALNGGNLSDALVDFTSGISETIEVDARHFASDERARNDLFKKLLKEKENHALMCCAVAAENEREMETRTAVGLIKGHAYGITAIRRVNLKDTRLFAFLRGREKVNMVRLRNPWGEREWNGAFSDGSPEWQRISSSEREKIGLTFEEDGEFWMTFEDFLAHFTEVSVCYLLNTAVFTLSQRWFGASVRGQWTTGVRGSAADRAGGCANNVDSFLRNPQYCFDITDDDQQLVVQLSQPDVRERRREGAQNLIIGLHVLKVEENRTCRVHTVMETVARSDYVKSRSIILHQDCHRGRYVLLPTTFEPGRSGEFLVRFFATCRVRLRPLRLDAPRPSAWPCLPSPVCVTSVRVRKVSGLANNAAFGTVNPYCLVRCEGQTQRSAVVRDAETAVWDFAAIFYRKRIRQPIAIEVWDSNVLVDSFLGLVTIAAQPSGERKKVVADLVGRGEPKVKMAGRIVVEWRTEDDLDAL